jgi:chromate transporter
VGHAFAAIRAAVAVLVLQSVYSLYKNGVVDKPTLAIFGAALLLGMFNLVNPVLVIVAAAAAGLAVRAAGKRGWGGGP